MYEKQQEIEALEECISLTGRRTYSSVIRECTSNYPRLINELNKIREENKLLKSKLDNINIAVSDIEEIINRIKE